MAGEIELSTTGQVVVGAFSGILDALQPKPTAAVPTTQVRPDVQVGLGIPREFLLIGGLALVGLVGVLLLAR